MKEISSGIGVGTGAGEGVGAGIGEGVRIGVGTVMGVSGRAGVGVGVSVGTGVAVAVDTTGGFEPPHAAANRFRDISANNSEERDPVESSFTRRLQGSPSYSLRMTVETRLAKPASVSVLAQGQSTLGRVDRPSKNERAALS
jgi:hypothetical protein